MAVRQNATPTRGASRRAWFVAACLLALFVAALFLRAYWNLDAANPEEGKFVLSGGSDPYYHKRAVDAIQANGFQHLIQDPLLNYPQGSSNPNPPLYEWSIAVAGQLMSGFFDGGLAESTWQAAIWSPAIFGALTVFPVYFLGAALFDRRAGLIAALLWTVSTSAIDATGVGLADHDGAVMFFASLSFLFYVQTIRHFRGDGNWVTRWNDGGAIGSGFGRMFRERRAGFLYAILAGISLAAVALTWKGFNYVLGIFFLYAVVQMVVDHWRNRDSTGLFLATLVTMLVGVLMAYPYYAQAGVANFLQPTWYILAAFVVAGVVLVPTRDLPTILVMPAALVVGILAAVVAFFVFPTVAQSLLYATVYFKQTRLYETIAEAHPADFSTILFGIGPVPFFLALFGWFVLLFRVANRPVQAWIATATFLTLALVAYVLTSQIGDGSLGLPIVGAILLTWLIVMFSIGDNVATRPWAFLLLWAGIALFMASSAVRFLFNAIPVFAVLAGFMATWVLDWLDFTSIRKSLAANQGNAWAGFRKGVRPLHVVAVVLIALLFVFPTTMLAADAALPPEAENRLSSESDSEFVKNFYGQRMGAYGQGFIPGYWVDGLTFLDQHDAHIADPAQRPAFLSWWDYGHWAIAVGKHPAVADNFQNGYEFAANFILSQDETHAVQLLVSRLSEMPNANLEGALGEVGSANAAADAANIRAWQKANLTLEQSVDLLQKVEANTGKKIRYFATDIRMLPYDDTRTPNVDQSSIFYAPVKLKGDNPDDYVTTKINVGTERYLTVEEYEQLARDPIRQTSALGERYEYQDKFFNSMYWRAYVGTPVQSSPGEPTLGDAMIQSLSNPRPAFGLEHFRLVYADEQLKIIEYYHGATIEGRVTEEGTPLSGVSVTVLDDAGRLVVNSFNAEFRNQFDAEEFNVPHDTTTTDADGRYSLTAPFSLGGSLTVIAQRDGVEVGRATVQVSREQAEQRAKVENVDLTLQRGSVEGFVFDDVDGDGRYNESIDTLAGDAQVSIGGVTATSGADGKYRADGVSAGTQNVTLSGDTTREVGAATSRVRVQPGQTTTHNVSLQAKAATVTGTLVADFDGDGTIGDNDTVPFSGLTFTRDASVDGNTARNATSNSQSDGSFAATLRPGTYTVTATYEHASGDVYELSETLVVAAGESLSDRQLTMTKRAA